MRDIEFISYDGEYPNLCAGVLTLKIDGKEYTFGWPKDAVYPLFWNSGGKVTMNNNNEPIITKGPYTFDYDKNLNWLTPEERKHIEKLFNENVKHGCCGGCF